MKNFKIKLAPVFLLGLIFSLFVFNSCEKDIKDVIDNDLGNPDGECPIEYNPVCDENGKTYWNECEAKKAGVIKWVSGPCPVSDPNPGNSCIDSSKISSGACPTFYEPVCGCDGQTYGNDCEAENAGLASWNSGPCK